MKVFERIFVFWGDFMSESVKMFASCWIYITFVQVGFWGTLLFMADSSKRNW